MVRPSTYMAWSSINERYDTETLSRSLAVSFELVSAISGCFDAPLTCWRVCWGKGWWWEEERRRDAFGAEKTGVLSQNSQCQARHIPEMECAGPALTRGTFTQCAGGSNVCTCRPSYIPHNMPAMRSRAAHSGNVPAVALNVPPVS
jgi:hypothetical protein